jgi:hypothetical protein
MLTLLKKIRWVIDYYFVWMLYHPRKYYKYNKYIEKKWGKMEEIQNKIKFGEFEPKRTNRFVIKFEGLEIPSYLFRSFKLYNVGSEIIFITEIMEVVNMTINPQDLFKVTDVVIEHLDPTGVTVNGLKFQVKGINFIQKCDYNQDEITSTKIRMVVRDKTMNKLYNDDSNGN